MGAFETLVRKTPLVDAPALGVRLKLESLQRTGSFKLRGACLKLDSLPPGASVVAASAGNHGMGVALAGRTLGIPVEIVVPASTPSVKKEGIAKLGAKVTEHEGRFDDADAFARELAARTGRVYSSAYDDPLIIAGNGGTLGDEILAQAPGTKRIVLPVGGGGMIAGLARAVRPKGVEVVGVQPAANCAMHESLRDGAAKTSYDGEPTVAEGCEGGVAESTFALCKELGILTALVNESEILRAVKFAYEALGLVVEPTAAVALAHVRGTPQPAGTVVIVSGGNVEPELLDSLLRG
jgi:threonine dehydratase